jgi:ribosome maturation factor RimP
MAENREAVTARVMEIAERVGAREGIEIVDVQMLGGGGARVLRIFIDRPPVAASATPGAEPGQGPGVTHGDCEYISENVGTILDMEDVIPGQRYTLEVSSPGVERKLTKPRDFERFVGQKIKVALREPLENSRHWSGTLSSFTEGIIALEHSPGRTLRFPFDQVEKANLKFEW